MVPQLQSLMEWNSLLKKVSKFLQRVYSFCCPAHLYSVNPRIFPLGHFCPAVTKAVKTMKKGEKVLLTVKPQCKLNFFPPSLFSRGAFCWGAFC